MDKSKIIWLLLVVTNSIYGQSTVAEAHFSMPLEQTHFRRYAHPIEDSLVISSTIKDERITTNDKLELFIASKYPNETATHIWLFHKLTVSNLGEDYTIIKYQVLKDSISIEFKTVIFRNEENQFKEANPNLFENIYNSIKYCKTETFRAFLNSEKTKLLAIDAIKAQFKDAEGILDIDKLGSYLKTKPKELEKYCDF